MAGEAARQFDPTPGRFSEVGNIAEAPSVSTDLYKATPAVRFNDGRAMDAIGSALGSFFNVGEKALEQVDQINHQQDLIQIQRENQALEKQAVIDQKIGKPLDAQYADRHAYAGTYQVAAADAHAFKLGEDLRAHMAQQPLDGSVDLTKVAEDFYRSQIGQGTGNPEFDARLLSQFYKSAEQQIAQLTETQRSTVMQNTRAEVVQQFTQRVLSPDGITTPQFAEMRQRIGALVHGNTELRDKVLMSAIAGAVQNDGQGRSVLRAMQDLGLDKTEPEYFNRISGEVLKRTNAVKTFDAGQAVQRFQMDMAQEKAKYPHGILPPDRLADYAQRWFTIDSIHGVGMQRSGLEQEWSKGLAKEASVNLWAASYNQQYGTQDSTRVAAMFGKSPGVVMSEHYDAAMSKLAASVFPSLAESRDGTGLVSPMKSDQAAADYARLILSGGPNAGHRAASQDTISDTYKAEMGNPLLGSNAEQMERSFRFYNALSGGGMTKEQLGRYFPNEKAEGRFWTMRLLANGEREIKQIAKDLVDRPYDASLLESVSKSGHIDIAALAKRGGVAGKPEEIERKITEQFNSAILDTTDRKRWFGNKPVALDSNELAVRDGLLADVMMVQMRSRGTVDLDSAIQAVIGQTGKYIVVPGYDGALQAIRDPFQGRGRTMLHPLNEDAKHPLSITKGYAPIYAPGQRMVNAIGETEDLLATWAKDRDRAQDMIPGKFVESRGLYLERPNQNGLSRVKTSTGEAIQFLPGEKVALRTGSTSVLNHKAGYTETEVPSDPKAAAEFFNSNLGPGWYVQQDGYHGPQGQGYTLYYGGRLEVGEKERDELIERRHKLRLSYRNPEPGPTRLTENLGGAGFVYPKP